MSIRTRFSPSMAVATAALVLAAGTGGAAAKAHLLDGHAIRNGSIPAAKLHRGTLTGRQVRANALGGGQIAEGKLGKVPSAARADSAGSALTAGTASHAASADTAKTAGSAKSAGSADTVGGASVHPFDLRLPEGSGPTTAFDAGHLRLSATCSAGGAVDVVASTSLDHAHLRSVGTGVNTNDPDFTRAADHELSNGSEMRNVTYATPDGHAVTVQYLAQSQVDQFDSTICVLAGTAIAR